MSLEDFEMYWMGITVVEAQELLLISGAIANPHKKPHAQKQWHRDMHKKAFPKTWNKTESLTIDQLLEIQKVALNGE